MKAHNVVDLLYDLGWRSVGDAQSDQITAAVLSDALLDAIFEDRKQIDIADREVSANAKVISERNRLRELASACYAGLVAECDLPDEWANAFLAASQGEVFDTDGLLPFTRGEP